MIIRGDVEQLRFVLARQLREQGLTESSKLVLIRDRTSDLIAAAKKLARSIRLGVPNKAALEVVYANLLTLCESRGVKAYVEQKVDEAWDREGYRLTKDPSSKDEWLSAKTG